MTKAMKYLFLLQLPILIGLQNCSSSTPAESGVEHYSMDDYYNVVKIDVHAHVSKEDPFFIEHAKSEKFRLLSINVDAGSSIYEQQEVILKHLNSYPDDLAWATTFKVDNWNDDDWAEQTIAYLKKSFDNGAVAVKVWKNVGMELKDKDGNFVTIDNPRFDPVINFINENNKTLIGHIGEPLNCWLPIEEMTVSGDREYFSNHPEYHMYLHPEYLSHEELMETRDNMLRKHPDLKFVGAHLASLEWSVDELAKRLDEFPNMAVDMAERVSHFQHQAVTDWQKVHDFFIKYQDQLVYGTDLGDYMDKEPEELKKHAHEVRLRHWKFFTSGEEMEVPKVTGKFKGLNLPATVVDKIYRKNAEKWFPVFNKALASN